MAICTSASALAGPSRPCPALAGPGRPPKPCPPLPGPSGLWPALPGPARPLPCPTPIDSYRSHSCFYGFHTLPQSRAGFNRHGGFLAPLHCAGRIPLRSTAFRGVRIFAHVSENFSGALPRCQHPLYFPIRSRLTTSVGTLLESKVASYCRQPLDYARHFAALTGASRRSPPLPGASGRALPYRISVD